MAQDIKKIKNKGQIWKHYQISFKKLKNLIFFKIGPFYASAGQNTTLSCKKMFLVIGNFLTVATIVKNWNPRKWPILLYSLGKWTPKGQKVLVYGVPNEYKNCIVYRQKNYMLKCVLIWLMGLHTRKAEQPKYSLLTSFTSAPTLLQMTWL